MKKLMKKIFAVLVTTTLVAVLLPLGTINVKAATTITFGTGGDYATLALAEAAAINGDTLKMLSPVTGSTEIYNKTLTLDLNGFILTRTGNYYPIIELTGDSVLTITDTSPNVLGKVYANSGPSANAIELSASASLRLIKGTIETTTSYPIYHNSTGTVTIKGGLVTSSDKPAMINLSTGKIVIDGGKVTTASPYSGIQNNDAGTIEMKNGEISATHSDANAIWNNGNGTITVSGGKITSVCTDPSAGTIALYDTSGSILNVSGGVIENKANPEGYSVYFYANSVTYANLATWLVKTGGTVGKVYPEAPKFTVTFNSNGGSPVAPITNIVSGSKIAPPTNPTKVNKYFSGWSDDVYWNFREDLVTANITLVAIWSDEASVYAFSSGAEGEWLTDSNVSLDFVVDGEYKKLIKLKVNGVDLDEGNFTVVSGSTKIKLKSSYLKTLAVGAYSFDVVYIDGQVSTNFTVAPADEPDTGDNNNVVTVAMIALLMLSGLLVLKKKKI